MKHVLKILQLGLILAALPQNLFADSPHAVVLAQQTAIDKTDPEQFQVIYRIIKVLHSGDTSLYVGDPISQAVNMHPDSAMFLAPTVDSRVIRMFELNPAAARLEPDKWWSLYLAEDTAAAIEALNKCETLGTADVDAIEKLATPAAKAAAFAHAAKTLELPSISLIAEAQHLSTLENANPDIRLPLSDGLSYLLTRQDTPFYLRQSAFLLITDCYVIDEEKEKSRNIQVMLRLFEAFHSWNPELPDGTKYPMELISQIEMRMKWPKFAGTPALALPLTQFFIDAQNYQDRLRIRDPGYIQSVQDSVMKMHKILAE